MAYNVYASTDNKEQAIRWQKEYEKQGYKTKLRFNIASVKHPKTQFKWEVLTEKLAYA